MRKLVIIFSLFFLTCQQDYGNLKRVAKLPKQLEEVSGIYYDKKRDAFWMLNDGDNSSSVFLVIQSGQIIRELQVDFHNNDWEDISMDKLGNLYVGDFGNNGNDRKTLSIIKINAKDLESNKKVSVQSTHFSYPEQTDFPPKEKYFDAEGFFELNGYFYLFTKSRVKNQIGKTFLYKIPNQEGRFKAQRISEFMTCGENGCWITGADISEDGKKVALVNHKSAWIFTNFTNDDFFSGKATEYEFDHDSQKESITFKNNNTIFVADEDESRKNSGRNLYSLDLKPKP